MLVPRVYHKGPVVPVQPWQQTDKAHVASLLFLYSEKLRLGWTKSVGKVIRPGAIFTLEEHTNQCGSGSKTKPHITIVG
jgi:hypothetical protein